MSIKVYDGYCVPIQDLSSFVVDVSQKTVEVIADEFLAMAQKAGILPVDYFSAFERNVWERWHKYTDRDSKDRIAQTTQWVIFCSAKWGRAFLVPTGSWNGTEIMQYVKTLKYVTSIPYWDNSDAPEPLPEDWELRATMWDEALDLPKIILTTFSWVDDYRALTLVGEIIRKANKEAK